MAENQTVDDKTINEVVAEILRSGRAFSIKIDKVGNVMTMSVDVQKLIGVQNG